MLVGRLFFIPSPLGFQAGQLRCPEVNPVILKSTFLQQVQRGLGLAQHRGWTTSLIDRRRDLVKDSIQPRHTAPDAPDEQDEEACSLANTTRKARSMKLLGFA